LGVAAIKEKLKANEEILAASVRLIGEAGEQVGVMPTAEALTMAQQAGLDLVEVSPNADPPVCKVMDYGKYQYQRSKREHESKKKSHRTDIKELRFRPNTDKNDLERKLGKAREFLEAGHRVQLNMVFRGREMAHTDLGREMLMGVAARLDDLAKIERRPGGVQGRRINALLAPREQQQPDGR